MWLSHYWFPWVEIMEISQAQGAVTIDQNSIHWAPKNIHINQQPELLFWIPDENCGCQRGVVAIAEQGLRSQRTFLLLMLPYQWGGWGCTGGWEGHSWDSWPPLTIPHHMVFCSVLKWGGEGKLARAVTAQGLTGHLLFGGEQLVFFCITCF